MSKSLELQNKLKGLVTTQHLARKYNVTSMTIDHWRKRGMPAVVIDGTRRDTIRFVPDEVSSWVKSKRRLRMNFSS
jgi:phage terminase Nu1 subunit (DNA packaging protein)